MNKSVINDTLLEQWRKILINYSQGGYEPGPLDRGTDAAIAELVKALLDRLPSDVEPDNNLEHIIRTQLNRACYFWEPKEGNLNLGKPHPGFEALASQTMSQLHGFSRQNTEAKP